MPYKNLAVIGNRPLIQIAIEFAFELGGTSANIIVSTESSEIGAFAQRSGATIWDRPSELSSPKATIREVLFNDAKRLFNLLGSEGVVVVLLPTSPFRSLANVLLAIELLQKTPQASGVVSVSSYSSPLAYRLGLERDGAVLQFPNGDNVFNSQSRRQQHASFYYPDGALYAVRIARFMDDPRFFVAGETLGIISDRVARLDIDSIEDLEFARLIAERIEKEVENDN